MAPPSARVGGSRCSGYSRTCAGEWEALNAPSGGDPLMLCSDWWTRACRHCHLIGMGMWQPTVVTMECGQVMVAQLSFSGLL
jgi:hypothetical protein